VNGSKLRKWRERKRLSLGDMADLTGFSAMMFSLVERGERSFSLEGKILVSRRLGVPLRDLFEVEPVEDAAAMIQSSAAPMSENTRINEGVA